MSGPAILLGAVMSGIIGVVIGALRGHKRMGTDWWLGFLLGPIGWIITVVAKEKPQTVSLPPALPASTPPPPAAPAGWLPDPSGRFIHRYWDGGRWTEHVHDGTAQRVDPV